MQYLVDAELHFAVQTYNFVIPFKLECTVKNVEFDPWGNPSPEIKTKFQDFIRGAKSEIFPQHWELHEIKIKAYRQV